MQKQGKQTNNSQNNFKHYNRKKIQFQPPGEPREQHLGEVRQGTLKF